MPRRRLPDNVVALRGTLRKNPQRARARRSPAAPGALGEPPAFFTPKERAAWAMLAACAPEGTLGRRDEPLLILAARLYAEIQSRPIGKVPSSHLIRMESMLARLGLSPADAGRVQPPPPENEPNEFDELINPPRRGR